MRLSVHCIPTDMRNTPTVSCKDEIPLMFDNQAQSL